MILTGWQNQKKKRHIITLKYINYWLKNERRALAAKVDWTIEHNGQLFPLN